MKKYLLLLIGLSVATSALFAQISEDARSMTQGVNNALILEIPQTQQKFVEKLWRKYIKDYDGKTKEIDRRNNEYLTDDAEVVSIGGANTVDIYAQILNSGDGVAVNMWIDLGGAYLTSYDHPEQYTEAEKLLMRFALEVARETTKIELEAEEKKMKQLAMELKRLKRSNDSYHREIEEAKERIRKAEENIVKNEEEQVKNAENTAAQQQVIEAVKKRLEDL